MQGEGVTTVRFPPRPRRAPPPPPPPGSERSASCHVVYCPRPFATGQDAVRFEAPPGQTFMQLVERAEPDRAAWGRLVVSVDDHLVPRESWAGARPKPGTMTVVTPLPANGRQALQAVLLIAIAVAAVYTGGAAATAAGGVGTTSGLLAGAAAATAVPLAGPLADAGLVRPPPA